MKTNLRQTIFGTLAVLLMIFQMTALAQEKRDTHNAGQAANQIEADEQIQNPLLLSVGSATFGSLSLTVQVDPKYCATGGVQCIGAGMAPGTSPADTNRTPVRLGLQVLRGGQPVNNLTDADVSVINSFVPAGGAAVSQLACANCFQNAGNGMYAIFVNPGVNLTWKPGSYFVQVVVQNGQRTERALAQIEVPF
jgi:hypothetical protein